MNSPHTSQRNDLIGFPVPIANEFGLIILHLFWFWFNCSGFSQCIQVISDRKATDRTLNLQQTNNNNNNNKGVDNYACQSFLSSTAQSKISWPTAKNCLFKRIVKDPFVPVAVTYMKDKAVAVTSPFFPPIPKFGSEMLIKAGQGRGTLPTTFYPPRTLLTDLYTQFPT